MKHNYELERRVFEMRWEADKLAIGSHVYEGVAYFWSYEYRHYLRDATPAKRRAVHRAFLRAGLEPSGESARHEAIVLKYAGNLEVNR